MKWSGTKEGWDRLVQPVRMIEEEEVTMRELMKNHYLLQMVTEKCMALEKTVEGYDHLVKAGTEVTKLGTKAMNDSTQEIQSLRSSNETLSKTNLTLMNKIDELENKLKSTKVIKWTEDGKPINQLDIAKETMTKFGYIFYKPKNPDKWGKGKRSKK